jgi:hypothetical protein
MPTLVPTHRLVGPVELDVELRSLDASVRACFRAAAKAHVTTPRLRITLVARYPAPPRVVTVDPSDASAGLVMCVSDVFTSELVRPLASTEPMIVIAGAPM